MSAEQGHAANMIARAVPVLLYLLSFPQCSALGFAHWLSSSSSSSAAVSSWAQCQVWGRTLGLACSPGATLQPETICTIIPRTLLGVTDMRFSTTILPKAHCMYLCGELSQLTPKTQNTSFVRFTKKNIHIYIYIEVTLISSLHYTTSHYDSTGSDLYCIMFRPDIFLLYVTGSSSFGWPQRHGPYCVHARYQCHCHCDCRIVGMGAEAHPRILLIKSVAPCLSVIQSALMHGRGNTLIVMISLCLQIVSGRTETRTLDLFNSLIPGPSNFKAFRPEFSAYRGLARVLKSPSNPQNCRKKERILAKGTGSKRI